MGASSSTHVLKLKIREISITNINFYTENNAYHYSVHPDRAPFVRVYELSPNEYPEQTGTEFTLPNTSDEEFRVHLDKCNANGKNTALVKEYFEKQGLKEKKDIWKFIKAITNILSGMAAIGGGILMIANK